MSTLATLVANAWDGEALAQAVGHRAAGGWAVSADAVGALAIDPVLHARALPDLADWTDERVGWGVVLPAALASLGMRSAREYADAAEPLRTLITTRDAPVFRVHPTNPYLLLERAADGTNADIGGAPRGRGGPAIPYYLMLCGSPEQIPWRLQYILSANRCVGRLPLTGAGLEHYIAALLGEWKFGGAAAQASRAVVWAVDRRDGITTSMRRTVAAPLVQKLRTDGDVTTTYIDGDVARAARGALTAALRRDRPAFIATTSHGSTPISRPDALRESLGSLVDHEGECVDASWLDGWDPAGAIWYAHACCSAGADASSTFGALFDRGTPLHRLVHGIAAAGTMVSPLPLALLGAKRPLRAFVGHVEPTFDYALENPIDKQPLTAALVDGLYERLFQRVPQPVGLALAPWFAQRNTLWTQLCAARDHFDQGADTVGLMLFYQLAARDIESTVILGDPAAALPAKS